MYLFTKDYKKFQIRACQTHEILREFQGAKQANLALPGDIVDINCNLIERKSHPMIAGLLELNSKYKFGYSGRGVPIYLFTPFNESYPQFIVGSSEKDTSKNRHALIYYDSWTDTFPRGILQRLIDSEEEALSLTYTPWSHLTYKGPYPDPPVLYGRKLLSGTTFHIDPEGCQDVDDVLTFDHIQNDLYVTITIADVASQVPEDHPLDMRAKQIGQTFYQDGSKPQHMFPPKLNLSLGTGSKPGLSLRFPLSDPKKTEWFESIVTTNETYTYESVYESQHVHDLKKLSEALGLKSDDSHKWIEAAMLFYNKEAAQILYTSGVGLFRIHSEPEQKKLEKFTKLNEELKFMAFSSAQYTTEINEKLYHYGLDTKLYTHASSPIRRYADLVNQRVIKALLNNSQQPKMPDPHHLNIISRSAKQHDRDLTILRVLLKKPVGITTGQIIEIRQKEDYQVKLTIYIKEWLLIVKVTYTQGSKPNTIISKDESEEFEIYEGLCLKLAYQANLYIRSWKRRMILRPLAIASS